MHGTWCIQVYGRNRLHATIVGCSFCSWRKNSRKQRFGTDHSIVCSLLRCRILWRRGHAVRERRWNVDNYRRKTRPYIPLIPLPLSPTSSPGSCIACYPLKYNWLNMWWWFLKQRTHRPSSEHKTQACSKKVIFPKITRWQELYCIAPFSLSHFASCFFGLWKEVQVTTLLSYQQSCNLSALSCSSGHRKRAGVQPPTSAAWRQRCVWALRVWMEASAAQWVIKLMFYCTGALKVFAATVCGLMFSHEGATSRSHAFLHEFCLSPCITC